MPFHALRRWLARHSAAGVLGLALGLAGILGGAQTAALVHEFAHLDDGSARPAGRAHPRAGLDCPTCLLAAALGGIAAAPSAPAVHAPEAALAAPQAAPRAFSPRRARAYASRAPPRAAAAA